MQESGSEKNKFIRFLVSKTFIINLGIAAVVFIAIFIILFKFLDFFTMHGKELIVPDFSGMTVYEVDSAGYFEQFDLFVIDSLYDDNNKKGAIVIQDPMPGSRVKKGRNIYVSIVATMPETVIIPDLKDLTLRQAVNILESHKLRAGKLIYEPSFDKNAILEQLYRGDTAHPGDTLQKGSVIDLVIGSGEKLYRIPVPFLIGKTREEAIYDLNIASFNLGSEFFMDSIMDESTRVYMQEPMWDSDIPHYPGDSIHLWYKSDELFDFEVYMQTFLPDSLRTDSLTTDSAFAF